MRKIKYDFNILEINSDGKFVHSCNAPHYGYCINCPDYYTEHKIPKPSRTLPQRLEVISVYALIGISSILFIKLLADLIWSIIF